MPDLTHIKFGDKLAIPRPGPRWGIARGPRVTSNILVVNRVTATQIVCEIGRTEVRIRRKDGLLIGKDSYILAIEATDEIIAQHNTEVEAFNRWQAAVNRCDDILKIFSATLSMPVETMEAIAHAYEAATSPGTKVVRKGYVCKGCDFVYLDEPTSKCDCSLGPTGSDEFIPATVTYNKP